MIIDVARRTGVAAATLIAVVSLSPGPAAAVEPGNPTGATTQWTQTWSDEFRDPAGSGPSPAKWGHDVGEIGWPDGEQEFYTDAVANAYQDGENLTIDAHTGDVPAGTKCRTAGEQPRTVDCTHTSARLVTHSTFRQKYGRFEARIKVPAADGYFPAFWAQGRETSSWPANGEIDWMEVMAPGQRDVHFSPIGKALPGCTLHQNKGAWGLMPEASTFTPSAEPLSTGYHVYSGDWFADHISFAVDGHTYATVYRQDVLAAGCQWPFDQEFFLLLNLAVGGASGTPAVDRATMSVDYVRVFTPAVAAGTITDRVFGLGATGGNCLAAASTPANGVAVKTNLCAPGALNQVTVTGGLLMIGGRCLDVQSSGLVPGTPVQMYNCNGTGAQQWRIESNSSLVNPQSGLCLSAQNKNKLVVDHCTNDKHTYEAWSPPAPRQVSATWPVDEKAGTALRDTTGAHTLTCTGGTSWAVDGAHLNGQYQACSAADPIITTTSAYTVAAWVRPNTAPGSVDWAVAGVDGTNVSAFYLEYNHLSGTWAMNLPGTDATTAVFRSTTGGPAPKAGDWTLLTGRVEPATGAVTLFVDGLPKTSMTVPTSSFWKAEGKLSLGRGRWARADATFFPGRIGAARTWNHAAEDADILAFYNATKSRYETA
ncbi:LamG-like jellyroll fold domain-containing protein [Actinoplanes sp. NPDC051494]|uniref:LamG-like jellyroll fold domain-containing protein n=1 Tax=Actinoplanes sp. NPDC051494 TaxID=3363907 RepID=UPI0037B8315B